jgi:hypothetical protein
LHKNGEVEEVAKITVKSRQTEKNIPQKTWKWQPENIKITRKNER